MGFLRLQKDLRMTHLKPDSFVVFLFGPFSLSGGLYDFWMWTIIPRLGFFFHSQMWEKGFFSTPGFEPGTKFSR